MFPFKNENNVRSRKSLCFFNSCSFVYLHSCPCKRSWKLNSAKMAPTKPPNPLSVISPLIPWPCDITHHHHVARLHNFCLYPHGRRETNWKLKTWRSRPATRWAFLAQACVSGPMGADWVVEKGALKGQEFVDGLHFYVEKSVFQNCRTCRKVRDKSKNMMVIVKF